MKSYICRLAILGLVVAISGVWSVSASAKSAHLNPGTLVSKNVKAELSKKAVSVRMVQTANASTAKKVAAKQRHLSSWCYSCYVADWAANKKPPPTPPPPPPSPQGEPPEWFPPPWDLPTGTAMGGWVVIEGGGGGKIWVPKPIEYHFDYYDYYAENVPGPSDDGGGDSGGGFDYGICEPYWNGTAENTNDVPGGC